MTGLRVGDAGVGGTDAGDGAGGDGGPAVSSEEGSEAGPEDEDEAQGIGVAADSPRCKWRLTMQQPEPAASPETPAPQRKLMSSAATGRTSCTPAGPHLLGHSCWTTC